MKQLLLAVLTAAVLAGCASHLKVAPVTVEPIHITVDINVHDTPDGPAKH